MPPIKEDSLEVPDNSALSLDSVQIRPEDVEKMSIEQVENELAKEGIDPHLAWERISTLLEVVNEWEVSKGNDNKVPHEALVQSPGISDSGTDIDSGKDAEQLQDFGRSALETMERVEWRTDIRPEQIKRRLVNVGMILAIGIVGTVTTLVAIGTGLPKGEHIRLLTVFMLTGSLALTFASSLAVALVSWSAFVYQFVRAERRKNEARIIWDAAIALGRDPAFGRAVVNLVASVLRNASPESTGLPSPEQASGPDETLVVPSTQVGEKLSGLIHDHLLDKEEVFRLIDEEDKTQHAA